MAGPSARPYVLRPGEGRAIDLGNFAMSLKSAADDTDGAFTLLEPMSLPASVRRCISTMTADRRCRLAGEYFIFIGDEEYVCPAGSFIYIPQGTPHGFRVGSVQSRKLNLYAPGAMNGYFDDLSTAIADGETDEVALPRSPNAIA